MTIRTNAAEEELDTAVLLDLSLIGLALSLQILGVAVEDVDILGPEKSRIQKSRYLISMWEKNLPHMKE